MKSIKLKIEGMTCVSCEVLIERKFKQIPGIENVRVNHASGTAQIYYTKEPNISELNELIKDKGYKVFLLDTYEQEKKAGEIKIKKDYIDIGAIFIILVGLYFILKYLNFLPENFNVSDNMSYGFVFVVGLVAAFSTCLAVTGGLLISITQKYSEQNPTLNNYQKFKPHIFFNLGRILSYTLFGGLIGLLGSLFILSPFFNGFLTILAGFIMVVFGIQLLKIFPWISNFQFKLPKFFAHKIYDASNKKHTNLTHFLFGGLTFFLPCGFTQALQFYILSKGDFLLGGFTMFFFSLGTLPTLISLGAVSSFTKGTFHRYFVKTSAVLVIILGILSINNGLVLASDNFNVLDIFQKNSDLEKAGQNVKLIDGKQIAEMKVIGLDYYPSEFNILKDIPVEWRIDGSKAQGCARVISAPGIGILDHLPSKGIKKFIFTPKETGQIRFSCSMGMAGPGMFIIN